MCLTRNLIMRIETNFKEDLFKEELVEKYIFVSTPILIKMTFSGCRCAAFYDWSTDSSRKLLIKGLILLGSPPMCAETAPGYRFIAAECTILVSFQASLLDVSFGLTSRNFLDLRRNSWSLFNLYRWQLGVHWDLYPTPGLTWRCQARKKDGGIK